MRVRSLPLAVAALVLGATLALAEPRMIVDYANEVPRLTLTGNYAGASYAVYRAPFSAGDFQPITLGRVLCLGACSIEDRSAVAGETYRYRFDFVVPEAEGSRLVHYGPFVATISPALAHPVGVYVFPNPGRGPATVQLHVQGASTAAVAQGEAAIYDLAGRRQRVLHQGALAHDLTTLTWDGRDARGAPLPGGVYLLRFTAGGQQAMMRIIRR